MTIQGTIQSYDTKSQTATVAFVYQGGSYAVNIPVSKAQVHAGGIVVNARCVVDILDVNNPRNAVVAYVY